MSRARAVRREAAANKTVPRFIACACALASLACAAVPTLRFESDDGSAGAVDGDVDAGDGALDAAGPEASCPDALPPGASVCCGIVPCNGNCATMCTACATTCGPATLCCARANGVSCRAPTAPCN